MMVQQLKEDQAGKSEEELSECFRIFDKYKTQSHTSHVFCYTRVLDVTTNLRWQNVTALQINKRVLFNTCCDG